MVSVERVWQVQRTFIEVEEENPLASRPSLQLRELLENSSHARMQAQEVRQLR